MNNKVAAIVSAYNEAPRIALVLKALLTSRHINEVIVVDDGSSDNIDTVMQKFPLVRYLKNDLNQGKGYSLERASKATDAGVFLFCDADFLNLTPEILEAVIMPVVNNKCDMFVGIYETSFHKYFDKILALTAFPAGINSGLRSVRRNVWEALPSYYKHGYKLESGLNYLVKWKFNGPLYEHTSYRQVSNESKRGIIKGTIIRLKMGFEVIGEFMLIQLYERFFGFGKRKREDDRKTKLDL